MCLTNSLSVMDGYDTYMTQTTYNNANVEERTKQLHTAKVEESQIQELSRTQFENLPQPIQERLNAYA
jgi:hypothetical protein